MTNQSKRKMNPAYFGIIWSRYQRNKSIDKTAQLENWSHETVRRVVASNGNYKKYQDIAHGVHGLPKPVEPKKRQRAFDAETNKVLEFLEAKDEMRKMTAAMWALRATLEKFADSKEEVVEKVGSAQKKLPIDDANVVIQ